MNVAGMVSKGTLNFSLDRCLLFVDGVYKASLELSCKNENLNYSCSPNHLQNFKNGKVLTREWMQPAGLENVVVFKDQHVSVELTAKSLACPVYLHATLLKFDENKLANLVNDGFTVLAHGKVLLYPKKRLFNQNKTILHTKYKSKLKFVSLLDNEMVQAVCGWMDVGVEVNITHTLEEMESDSGKSSEITSLLSLQPDRLDNMVENIPEMKTKDENNERGLEESYQRTYGSQIQLNFSLPDLHAVRDLIPTYYALANEMPDYRASVLSHIPIVEPDTLSVTNSMQEQNRGSQIGTGHMAAVLYHQTKEIEKHKQAIQGMAKHIQILNCELDKLKHEKSQLFSKLYYAGEDQDFADADEKSNEHKQLVILKRRLAAENVEKNELQERVHILQNEIIQKNEMELKYLELQKAHEQQQVALLEAQSKATKTKLLQKTCNDQEKVIEALEKERGAKSNGKEVQFEDTTKKSAIAVTESLQNIDDKLHLVSELEHAHNTIDALQKQIEINTRAWIREKTLLEQEAIPGVNQRPALRSLKGYSFEHGGEPYSHQHWASPSSNNNNRGFPRYSYHLGGRGGSARRHDSDFF